MNKRKIVFLCESVTLAHVARSRLLADSLPTSDFTIKFYCDGHYESLFESPKYPIIPLGSTPPAQFVEWNLKSQPIWPKQRIQEYFAKDLVILEEESPDLVIGDMRQSLQISARKLGIPYLNVINGYWCAKDETFLPIPDVLPRRLLGTSLAQKVFNALRPLLMIPHTTPFSHARKNSGLPPLRVKALPHIFCEADYNVYLDLPQLVDMDCDGTKNVAIGPVLWSPKMDVPSWWQRLPINRPIIYINFGSSGDPSLLPSLVDMLAELNVTLIVGTASKDTVIEKKYDNVFSEAFIPGDKASDLCDICISNGGSPTTMQALASGAYCIGVCFNIDQLVNMHSLKEKGVGDYFYPTPSELPKIKAVCEKILNSPVDLSSIQKLIQENDPYQRFRDLIGKILG